MKTDSKIKEDVLEELKWQPNIDETQIGVVVEDGVVTLTGFVDSYSKKITAEKAVKKVAGVRAIAENIEVKYGDDYKKTDKEIAKATADALEWNASIPHEKIKIEVKNGTVYLSGDLEWSFQKNAAKNIVQNLMGVKSVVNNIILKQSVEPFEIKNKISRAFERMAELDAKNIHVEAEGHRVRLTGKVHSLKEKDEARKAAYNAPGVDFVDNDLEVAY